MFCTNCGKENKDTDLFCKYCGTPLKKPQLTNQSTTPEQQVAPKPAPEQQPDFQPAQQPTSQPAQQPASEPAQQAASTQQSIPIPEATTPLQPIAPSSTVADETQPQTQVRPQHQKQSRTRKPMKTGTKVAILAIVAILAGLLIGGTAFAITQGYIQLPWEKHEETPAEQPEETPAEGAENSKDTQEPAEKDDKNPEPTIPDQPANLKIGQFYKNYLGNFNADWLLASTTDGIKSKGTAQYALGDVNGDGITDLIVSVPTNSGDYAYAYTCDANGKAMSFVSNKPNDFTMPGGLEWHQVNDTKAVDTFADFKGYNTELTKGLKSASQGQKLSMIYTDRLKNFDAASLIYSYDPSYTVFQPTFGTVQYALFDANGDGVDDLILKVQTQFGAERGKIKTGTDYYTYVAYSAGKGSYAAPFTQPLVWNSPTSHYFFKNKNGSGLLRAQPQKNSSTLEFYAITAKNGKVAHNDKNPTKMSLTTSASEDDVMAQISGAEKIEWHNTDDLKPLEDLANSK